MPKEYEIVDKPEENRRTKRGWCVEALDPLPMDKALKFECIDSAEAGRIAASVRGSIARNRLLGYIVRTCTEKNGNKVYLFVWKKELGKKGKLEM